VDQLLDNDDDLTIKSVTESGEVESLTSSLIDGLYKQIKTNEIAIKK